MEFSQGANPVYKLVSSSLLKKSLPVSRVVKFNLLMLVSVGTLYFKAKTSVSRFNLTTLVTTSD